MKTGYQGTFVISWAQTEIDGTPAPAPEIVTVGACWRWTGEAIRVDGPNDMLILQGAKGEAARRARAAKAVRRLLGDALGAPRPSVELGLEDSPNQSFTVTDGYKVYVVTLVELPESGARLLMFSGHIPQNDTDLWVVDRALDLRPKSARKGPAGVICFTPGTLIDTPQGKRPVEALRPGDQVATCDNGPQAIRWIGQRRISGARLHAMPHLRPVRISGHALGHDRPDADLLVSPQHRMLLRGAPARALFAEDEVLVRACDLVNGSSVRIEAGMAELHYIHLLLDRHEVLWANGLESESFHPASTVLSAIAPDQRDGLRAVVPEVESNPLSYGAYARRALKPSEAAILRHDLVA
ncbi:hemolysin-type calcium-binding protein [Thioclava dalianensis]|uniref:Hemolysin-type calcium-binding protein n=1 Tax=Thioclava dalianensis TaxID=1185766 RepID=A0A074TH82_9RHOB|nr:Hint domain-containing protein [Thioclava dalianensis]KEP71066.1 hemolysin-type calcium-binding protein [Thioclava dalianensis]SFN25607.1 Hint domain-containing protein [Thioclava dalianensis]